MTSKSDNVSGTASESNSADDTDTDESAQIPAEVVNQLDRIEEQVGDDNKADDIEDRRPDWVFDKFIKQRRADGNAESGLQSYRSAWGQFEEWMEEEGHTYLTDLSPRFPGRHDGWIVSHDEYEKKKLSRAVHLSRIKTVARFAQSRGWIDPSDVPDDEAWDEVKPEVNDGEKIRSDPLPPERGEEIAKWVRANHFGGRAHVLWLLLFRYGFRVSAIRALDRDDLVLTKPDDWPEGREFNPHLRLKDRPELGGEEDDGLPLKNKREELAGRKVLLEQEHVEVFRHYVENSSDEGATETRKEYEEPDKYGLYGLVTGEQNPRLSARTIRDRTHWLTCPTTYGDECLCDGCREYRAEHGRNPYPSKVWKYCNETRSPHQVRHGAITSLLDNNKHHTISHNVGTSIDTIRDVYDSADDIRRMNRTAGDWLSG